MLAHGKGMLIMWYISFCNWIETVKSMINPYIIDTTFEVRIHDYAHLNINVPYNFNCLQYIHLPVLGWAMYLIAVYFSNPIYNMKIYVLIYTAHAAYKALISILLQRSQ